jgi:hypothetical protein
MASTSIVGIDPGLVDTGVVRFTFYPKTKRVAISSAVEPAFALDSSPQKIEAWIRGEVGSDKARVFIEKYNPRPGIKANVRMQEMENILVRTLHHTERINNMGIKTIITTQMMQLFQVWNFSVGTHHQDLRSAARIALYGAVKDDELNQLVADVVRDHWVIDLFKAVKL